MSAPRCESCRYFHRDGDQRHHAFAVGECRRRSPTVGQYTREPSLWPMVPLAAWCGEYAEPGSAPPDPIAAAAADVAQWIKDRIALCGHGSISITCGPCMAPWLPR